jgi:hypothetical protein
MTHSSHTSPDLPAPAGPYSHVGRQLAWSGRRVSARKTPRRGTQV